MSSIKKLLCLALCLALLLTLAPRMTLTAHAEVLSGYCGEGYFDAEDVWHSDGENLSWTLDTGTGALTITGSGKMRNYSYYEDVPWYAYRESIRAVSLSAGMTSIGKYAFYGCTGLSSVTIPEGITSIGNSAFRNCSGLTSMNLPEGVISVDNCAFYNCTGLSSVTLPEGLAEICPSTFYGCTSLSSVTLPASIKNIFPSAFYDCSSLSSVSIPANVNTIGKSAFENCTGLTSVTISEGVTTIDYHAFYNCTSLTTVTIPASVTSIGDYVFGLCDALNRVNISDLKAWCEIAFGTYSSNPAYHAHKLYLNGKLLKQAALPEGLTAIRDFAFINCTDLTTVTIPTSVTTIGYRTFEGCTALTSVNIPSSVTAIDTMAFQGCSGLTSLTLSEGLTLIGESTFRNCTGLSSVSIPASVTTIYGWAFQGCTGLTSLTLSEGVARIGEGAFSGCTGLSSVTIPASVTTVGSQTFYNSTSLENITVSPDNPNYSSLNGVLFNKACSELLQYPAGKPSATYAIPEGVTNIGTWAFGGCTGLSSVIIPAAVTSIGRFAFYGCKNLTIYGYSGTTAETYANNNEIPFKALDPATGFADAKPGKFYYDAVLWAISQEPPVTKGTDDIHFSPNKTCTRGQVVTFLWNAMGQPEPSSTTNPFVDVKKNKFYYKPVLWAVENGITKGVDATHFNPNGECTRGQVVTFIWKAMGSPAPTNTNNPFTDVKKNKFYYKPVLWAVENGVTSGTTATTFSPDKTCTRGQVVTFLYNTLAK